MDNEIIAFDQSEKNRDSNDEQPEKTNFFKLDYNWN